MYVCLLLLPFINSDTVKQWALAFSGSWELRIKVTSPRAARTASSKAWAA